MDEGQDSVEYTKPQKGQKSLNLEILAIEKRNGLCSLICRAKKTNKLFKVILSSITITKRVKLYPHSSITISNYT